MLKTLFFVRKWTKIFASGKQQNFLSVSYSYIGSGYHRCFRIRIRHGSCIYGSGIVPLFLDCLILKIHCLDLQDQALSHSSWTAWPWRCTALIFRIRLFHSSWTAWSWRCTALICRIRHYSTLPGLLDSEDALPWSSGSGIVPLFLDCLTLKVHCLDIQDQVLSHSSWNAWPWRRRYYFVPNVGK